jgi:polyhydroxyalkanoate synthesis regulator phasin
MEALKHEQGSERDGLLKKGARVLAVMGALTGAFGHQGAHAEAGSAKSSASFEEVLKNSNTESGSETAFNELVDSIFKDGNITVSEVRVLRSTWEDVIAEISPEFGESELGKTSEDLLDVLTELAKAQEHIDALEGKIVSIGIKLQHLQAEEGSQWFGKYVEDPYAEGKAVEYFDNGEIKTAEELQADIDRLTAALHALTGSDSSK